LQTIGNFQFSGKLPDSTGENKYTENMTPGYTGMHTQQPNIAGIYFLFPAAYSDSSIFVIFV